MVILKDSRYKLNLNLYIRNLKCEYLASIFLLQNNLCEFTHEKTTFKGVFVLKN